MTVRGVLDEGLEDHIGKFCGIEQCPPRSSPYQPGTERQECWELGEFSKMGCAWNGARGGLVAVGWTITEF